jgi:glycosyltransferase involved in cell wall biosynthesis
VIDGMDPRLKVIRQDNHGFAEARNAGIRASTGNYLAFLDSDDEFLPHHLELGVRFLEAFPDEAFVGAELLEDFGNDRLVNHYRVETADWYPEKASRIRSNGFQLPPGETDDYMRVYESREVIGDWGINIVSQTSYADRPFLYRGRIFKHWIWGYLIALPATVIRRTALETVGLPRARYSFASDFYFMALMCRHFRANYLSVPTYIKHELTPDGGLPAEGHIATSDTVLNCKADMLRAFDDLFWNGGSDDREVRALRALRQFTLGQVALQLGKRDVALTYLKAAREHLPHFWEAIALEGLVRAVPSPRLSRKAWIGLTQTSYISRQLISGELTPKMFLKKIIARMK